MNNQGPKIIIVDIETSPIESYTWGPKYDSNIIEVIQNSQILSYSSKWLGGKQITRGIDDTKGYKPGVIDDKLLVKELWELIDQSDIVIGQNSKSFDTKVIQSRFLFHGMQPPSPFKQIDTKTEAKKYLRLPSYSLDDMCQYFGIGQKIKHEGFNLWKLCMAGDKSAWRRMKQYNKNDTIITEKLYLKLRPWMTNHINLGAWIGDTVCPKCKSNKLQSRGYARTQLRIYRRYQCQNCGGWSRMTKTDKESTQITNAQ